MPTNPDAIKLFKSSDMDEEVDDIEFDPIPVGETSTKTIFMKNTIDELILINNITIESNNNEISIDSFDDKIPSRGFGEIVLSANPNSNNLTGLKGQLNIEGQFVVRPE